MKSKQNPVSNVKNAALARIEKAKELLSSGKFQSVNEVVKAAGYPSREAMKNAFRKAGIPSPIKFLVVKPAGAKAALHQKSDEVDTGDLPKLKEWCTPAQAKAIDSLVAHGSITNAANALGCEPRQLRRWLSEAKHRAARAGWSPAHDMTKTVPEGFHVKGVSSYYDKNGELLGQWVKTKGDESHRVQLLLDALEMAIEPRKGCLEPIKVPKTNDKDLLCIYIMGDPHVGMYSWAAETGSDFDANIAERNLVQAVDHLVALAPAAENAAICNLGDYFHSDSMLNRTLRSGHHLDVDTRWARVLQIGIRAMQRCIDRALEKHKHVTVINEIGNHDDHTSIMLSVALSAFYSKEPRVTIDCSPAPFHWYRWGKCLVGVTHGDGPKASQLPGIMASDKPEDWGQTKYRYWYTGHVHSDSLSEFPGCTVESFRTLAPRDMYATRAGYRSMQDMKMDVLHKDYGKINRHIVGIEQLVKK
jgi:hypothetical protein